MSELSGTTTDAPPPPPPPPPPDTGAKEPTPEASPELASELSRDGQDGGQSAAEGGTSQDGAAGMDRAQEQADLVRPDLGDYQQEAVEVPDGSLVSPDPDPVPDASQQSSGSDGTSQDAMAAAQEQADPIRDELQAYRQDNPVEGDPSDASLTADDSTDPVRQRQTWEGEADGADLPPSMKEDLRGLGNDLGEIVDPDKWAADPDGRKDMLNAANDRIREEYGLPQQDASYRSVEEDPDLAGSAGYFDPNNGEVVLNSNLLDLPDPQEALKTLAHENFHDYQDRAVDGNSNDPFAQSREQEWREGGDNYPDPDDYDDYDDYVSDYQNNPLERDAVAVENEVYAGYKETKL
jgi:hypothetical protein